MSSSLVKTSAVFPDSPVNRLKLVSAGRVVGSAVVVFELPLDHVGRCLVDRHEAVDRVRVVIEDARAATVCPYHVCGGATCMTPSGSWD